MNPVALQPPSPDRKRILPDLFAVDLRSLAALRIGLGFVLLFDLAFRARFLKLRPEDALACSFMAEMEESPAVALTWLDGGVRENP